MTLAQAAAKIEENGQLVKVANFDSFADFASYYRHHYKPLLQAITDGEELDDNRRHLLNFLANDLLEMFGDGEEGTESNEQETIGIVELTFSDGDNYRKAQRIFDSDGKSTFWAADWNDETRTIEFTCDNDPEALAAALIEEMNADGITGYTWKGSTMKV